MDGIVYRYCTVLCVVTAPSTVLYSTSRHNVEQTWINALHRDCAERETRIFNEDGEGQRRQEDGGAESKSSSSSSSSSELLIARGHAQVRRRLECVEFFGDDDDGGGDDDERRRVWASVGLG